MNTGSDDQVYFGGEVDVDKVLTLHSEGVPVFCRRCGAQLIVVTTAEEARIAHRHPGIHCPTSNSHVVVLFNIREWRLPDTLD